MELVKCFKTSDGNVFESKSEAVKYQQELNIRAFLEEFADSSESYVNKALFVELFSNEKTLNEFLYGIDNAKCVLVD